MAPSHGYRFANQALPANVFDNPLAFARAVGNPRQAMAVLSSTWEKAGALMPAADRQAVAGIKASLVHAAPYLVILVEPPFPREVGDACAIAIIGKGDGENQLDAVSFYIMELGVDTATRTTRFVVVQRTADGEHGTNLGESPPDVKGFVNHCVELAAGGKPAPRDGVPLVAPWYWWHVARGAEVVRVFQGAPEHEAWSVIQQYPILLLPEMVDAAEQAVGASRAISGLREMQASLKGTAHFAPFNRMLASALGSVGGGSPRVNIERALTTMVEVRAAIKEGGAELGRTHVTEAQLRGKLAGIGIDPRRNYEKAIELYELARKEPAEPAERERDHREEHAIRAAVEKLAPPTATTADPTWASLFLDETELQGFQRREDRRDTNPSPNDPAFAASNGVAAGFVVWLGQESWPMWRIVDTRWLFPDAVRANAFAQAILPAVGEGLPTLPVPMIGDAALGWGGIQMGRVPGTRYAGQIVVFRVGRMVAKLFVAEGPTAPQTGQALAQSMLFPYAEAIVRRAHWAMPRYWLAVARGTEAANVFVQSPPGTHLFAQYPILLLPEFPAAMATLGEPHRVAAQALWNLQSTFKTDWYSYRDAIRALVRMLLDERNGDPRVNAMAALAVIVEHRKLDPDPAWATLESEARASSDRRP